MTNQQWSEALDRFGVDTEGGRSWNVLVNLNDGSRVQFNLLERDPYPVDGASFLRILDTDVGGRRIEVERIVDLIAATEN